MRKEESGDKPVVICLTPVRNEAWILARFLACTSLWADHIVVADQGSTDGSVEIAKAFPKVTLIENPSREFNEPERQKLLIAAARRIPGRRLLMALDADEILSANLLSHPEWDQVLAAPPGTKITARWANIYPGATEVSDGNYDLVCGMMDNGGEHHGEKIHSPRLPTAEAMATLRLQEIRLLHYNFHDPARLASKRRWYMALERRMFPEKSAVHIYDKYNFTGFHGALPRLSFRREWAEGYEKAGIEMFRLTRDLLPRSGLPVYWYDRELAGWLSAEPGAAEFRDVPIWSSEWMTIWAEVSEGSKVQDPRPWWLRLIHRLMLVGETHRYTWGGRLLFSLIRRLGF
jgi:glycosyltransferase involved in cell wall biosynthesis